MAPCDYELLGHPCVTQEFAGPLEAMLDPMSLGIMGAVMSAAA